MKNLVSLNKINKLAKERTPEVNKIEYAKNGTNKYIAVVDNKRIKFGNIKYEDFLIHKDEKRRKLYRTRHKNDKINKVGPGRYSWHLLW